MIPDFATRRSKALIKVTEILNIARDLIKDDSLSDEEQDRMHLVISNAGFVSRNYNLYEKRARLKYERKLHNGKASIRTVEPRVSESPNGETPVPKKTRRNKTTLIEN